LHAVLVTTLPEGRGSFGENAKKVHQDFAGLEGVGSEERLNKLGFSSLERWRLWGDLIEVDKIMRGKDRAYSQRLFPRWKCQLHGGTGSR